MQMQEMTEGIPCTLCPVSPLTPTVKFCKILTLMLSYNIELSFHLSHFPGSSYWLSQKLQDPDFFCWRDLRTREMSRVLLDFCMHLGNMHHFKEHQVFKGQRVVLCCPEQRSCVCARVHSWPLVSVLGNRSGKRWVLRSGVWVPTRQTSSRSHHHRCLTKSRL